jgi:ascorbate-specific PTS system EIIC-type component UlaA
MAGAVLLVASSAAFAEAPGGPNCGWGNMLFKGQSGMAAHFLASTTNGTSGNATFGMTSGTNGCSVNGTLTYGGKAMVNAMLDEFTTDVAVGHGDALTAVAVAYGVEQQDRAAFAQLAHQNFAVLFPSEAVTADEVVARLETLMQADERLSKYVI